MGYDLHITRQKFWFDDGQDIPVEEWLRYIESDSELELLGPPSGDYFARWSGPSKHLEPWFDWSQGNIYTKNPDEPILGKMLQIAAALNAKVQGDDGETYRSADFKDCCHEDTGEEDASSPPLKEPWPENAPLGVTIISILIAVIVHSIYFFVRGTMNSYLRFGFASIVILAAICIFLFGVLACLITCIKYRNMKDILYLIVSILCFVTVIFEYIHF